MARLSEALGFRPTARKGTPLPIGSGIFCLTPLPRAQGASSRKTSAIPTPASPLMQCLGNKPAKPTPRFYVQRNLFFGAPRGTLDHLQG